MILANLFPGKPCCASRPGPTAVDRRRARRNSKLQGPSSKAPTNSKSQCACGSAEDRDGSRAEPTRRGVEFFSRVSSRQRIPIKANQQGLFAIPAQRISLRKRQATSKAEDRSAELEFGTVFCDRCASTVAEQEFGAPFACATKLAVAPMAPGLYAQKSIS